MKQIATIENTTVPFNNKLVHAKKISVTSYFNHDTDSFFKKELVKTNTLKIVKPLAKIKFLKENNDSPLWEQGFDYELEIKPFGLFNVWGIHHIKIVSIDYQKTKIITIEKNNICRVWDHTLTFEKIGEAETAYTDQVILYAGGLTSFLSNFLVFSCVFICSM